MLCLIFLLVTGTLARAEQRTIDNYLVTIDNFILKNVTATTDSSTILDLSNLNLRAIDEGAFGNLEIRYLSLANNHLENLPPFVFHPLRNKLEYLSLANNTFRTLRYVFGSLKNIIGLDISYNSINELEEGSFYGLSEATEILAVGNDFGEISSRHFEIAFTPLSLCIVNGIVKSLEFFDEKSDKQNTDKCIIKVRQLTGHSVQLSGEEIKGFKKGWYRLHGLIVTSLNLRDNRITSITEATLNDLPEELIDVDLSVNEITNLTNGIINNPHLRKLNLCENSIEIIEGHAFDNTKNLEVVLSGNKLPDYELIDTLNCMIHIDLLPGTDIVVRYIVNPDFRDGFDFAYESWLTSSYTETDLDPLLTIS